VQGFACLVFGGAVWNARSGGLIFRLRYDRMIDRAEPASIQHIRSPDSNNIITIATI
jgi:hypothetical protein